MIFGAHVSTAGGLPNAIHNANKLGVKAIQIFPWSPRMWTPRAVPQAEIDEYNRMHKVSKLHSSVFHMIYLANPASSDPALYKKSVNAILQTVELAKKINAYGIVLHLGSNKNKREGITRVGGALKQALRTLGKSDVNLLLENSSGGGGSMGSNFDEIAKMIKAAGGDKRINVIIDTCHAYAAGYDIVSGYQDFLDEVRRTFGMNRIKAFHLNDSMFPLGGGRDRHENIGAGHIGKAAFGRLIDQKEFQNLPGLLEVPGFDGEGPDEKNLSILNSFKKKGHKALLLPRRRQRRVREDPWRRRE